MSDQKDIDKLFQERFQEFEASPDPAMWDRISQKLDAKEQEQDRKGIVFLPWLYKGAGIAAALILLFFVGNALFNTNSDELNTNTQTTSTTKKDTSNKTEQGSQITDKNADPKLSEEQKNASPEVVLPNEQDVANQNTTNDGNGFSENNNSKNTSQNSVAQQNNSSVTSQNATNDRMRSTVAQQNNTAVASSDQKNTNLRLQQNSQGTETNASSVDGAINTTVAQTTENQQNNTTEHTETGNPFTQNSSAIAENTNNSNTTSTTETSTEKEANTETAVAAIEKETEVKKSLLDVINELHELEKENTEVAETKRSKWTISPNAAPTYYNTLSDGSPIDQTFADNTKVGDLNLSYGLNVGYDVSKRLTVRSGIHRVDYSYSTKDIALVPSIDGTDLTTIAFRSNEVSFDIKDRQESSGIVYSQYQLPSSESSIREKQIEGNLNQRMSYIEVPVELKYAVLDKKLGVNVIGGVSTLLLTENSIILDAPELLAELGEATNLNDVSFSTNIGVGIDYKFSDQLEFNLEPMLKYQINTFSGNTGNFRPYSVGVYTGVSFRF